MIYDPGHPVAATLRTHGWTTWPTAARHLTDATCAWADLDGFHVDRCPAERPPTTHLWAWHGGTLWRARLDGLEVLLTELTIHPELPKVLTGSEPHTLPCMVQVTPAIAWNPTYDAIGSQPTTVLQSAYTLYHMPGDPDQDIGGIAFVSGRAQ
jgi:hypothetical protein